MIEKLVSAAVDRNILISAAAWPKSVPAQAFRRVLLSSNVLSSARLRAEYREVFSRPKFDAYASFSSRMSFLDLFFEATEPVEITCETHDCRDPKDNMLLELALSGSADLILTGDRDLLTLHPWRGIAILSPASYLLVEER